MKLHSVDTEIFSLQIPTPFSVGPINIFLIKGDTLTLVDTGPKMVEAREMLDSFLKKNGFVWRDIEQIFLTHQHVDHTGLLAEIYERSGARVIAHPDAVPYIEMDPDFIEYHDDFFLRVYRENGVPQEMLGHVAKFHQMLMKFGEPAPVHEKVEGGVALKGAGEWKTVFTPGHTQNHLALYREKDGWMLSGDFLIKEISSNAFLEPPVNREAPRALPLLVYRQAMKKIAEMNVSRMFSAHGEEITNHRELIEHRLKRHEERADKIAQLLEEGPKTVFELSMNLFPKLYNKELPLTFSETLGHLDLLEVEQRVEVVELDGVKKYRRTDREIK